VGARPDRGNPQRTRKLLSLQPVEEIWAWETVLHASSMLGIRTALDLALTNPALSEKFLRRSRANGTRTERGKLHVA
jgi:hypothetical protein